MGLGGISIWQLLIILVIVFAIFGTKRLRGLGGDLGAAIRGFKEGLSDEKQESLPKDQSEQIEPKTTEQKESIPKDSKE